MTSTKKNVITVAFDGSGASSLTADYTGKEFLDLDPKTDVKTFVGKAKDPLDIACHTNVYRICEAIAATAKGDMTATVTQKVQYLPGVVTRPGMGIQERFLLMAYGFECLDRMVQGYQWLCKAYQPGADVQNEVHFLGYSRGAFTARVVAGMVAKYGLLRAADGEAYDSGSFRLKCEGLRATYFKQAYSQTQIPSTGYAGIMAKDAVANVDQLGKFQKDIFIGAVGCWDTVGCMGVAASSWAKIFLAFPLIAGITQIVTGFATTEPGTYENYFDQNLSPQVHHAFHALALNEKMELFRPSLWELPPATTGQEATKLQQCWFAGGHLDVGGGTAGGLGDRQIADITLAWMMDRLQQNTAIRFKTDYLNGQVPKSKEMTIQAKLVVQPWGLGRTTAVYNKVKGTLGGWGWLTPLVSKFSVGENGRVPGWYHRLNPNGSRTDDYLRDTHEQVHQSVRVRLENPTGRGSDGLVDFAPTGLASWTQPSNTKDGWVWNGWTGTHDPLPQPPLGPLELVVQKAYAS